MRSKKISFHIRDVQYITNNIVCNSNGQAVCMQSTDQKNVYFYKINKIVFVIAIRFINVLFTSGK